MKIFNFLGLFLVLALASSCSNDTSHQTFSAFKSQNNALQISMQDDIQSLDPRLVRDLPTVTVLHMIYDGLMHSDFHGNAVPSLAEHVEISPDFKTYTFKIRETHWSNGDIVTANDFAETWKSVLNPKFPAPNANQLYVIKGAKDAKEGKAPLEQIGIHTPDAATIVVTLESPVPYFLELLTTHFYLPVHESMRNQDPVSEVIGNGPYKILDWKQHNELVAIKNSNHWDSNNVMLDKIVLAILEGNTALQMFQSGHLDWSGSPLGTFPPDAITSLKHHKELEIAPAAGTHWFRINTEKPPFNNVKMRKAFAVALDRQAIVEHILQGGQTAATGIVPPSFGLVEKPFFEDNNVSHAWTLFQDALNELNISIDEFPEITLSYVQNERSHKIVQAVQQQWSKAFGITIKLETYESKVLFDKIGSHDYLLALGSWFADYRDPISFLEIFKYKSNRTNNTQWENPRYIALLDESAKINDAKKRKELLIEAEKFLIDEMPVIPLYFAAFNYVKKDTVAGVYFSELGYLDFRNAYFANEEADEDDL